MQTTQRRGTYVNFSMSRDDKGLRQAIALLGKNGEKQLDNLLAHFARKAVLQAKKDIKALAGGLANTVVPPSRVFRTPSKNIHTKVSDALKVEKVKKLEHRIHTGKNLKDAELGVLGSRGGRLSHIVSKGMDPFTYGNLPMIVRSSTGWFKKTGAGDWVSTGMRMRAQHPGFYKTIDYMAQIEKQMKEGFYESSHSVVFTAALNSGFSVEAAGQMSGSSSSSMVGGIGAMSARKDY
tara:strand:- start:12138 stop:12845 length:708 start_codon:yes stop_codon:yes gene_type:complete